MSDPSTLLLSVCVACNHGADRSISLEPSTCRQTASQQAVSRGSRLKTIAPKCISIPEAIALAPEANSAADRAAVPSSYPRSARTIELASNAASASGLPTQPAPRDRLSSSPSPSATASLRIGSRGELVRALQARLQRLGYYNAAIDGIYGPLTHAAVLKFQQSTAAHGSAVTDLAASSVTASNLMVNDVAVNNLASNNLASDDSIANALAIESRAQVIQEELKQAIEQKREAFSQEPLIKPDASTDGEQGDRVTPSPTESPAAASADSRQQRVVWEPFSAAPSSTTFYLWLLAWAVVYIGGFVVIFLTSDSSLRDRWLSRWSSRRSPQQYKPIAPPTANELQALDLDIALDPEPLPPQPLPPQPPVPLAADIPAPPNLPIAHSSDAVDALELQEVDSEAIAIATLPSEQSATLPSESSTESLEEELPVFWADEVLTELPNPFLNIANLFDEWKAELQEESYSNTTDTLPVAEHVNESAVPSTILGILSSAESGSDVTYTYSFLDDAEGRFLLRDNELRIRDDVLHAIQADTSFVVKIRRTDSNGQHLDESLTLHLGIPDRSQANEDPEPENTEQLAPIA
jgi:peptidoglycan hydrolase-like protein with peptidoglycan-binding domain